jgi:hypothetical protein
MSGWKTGDTYPPLRGTVQDSGLPIDLTTADHILVYIRRPDLAVLVKTPIFDASVGGWSVEWSSSDLSVPGTYSVEVEVSWTPDAVQTFPGDGYATFTVTPQLA